MPPTHPLHSVLLILMIPVHASLDKPRWTLLLQRLGQTLHVTSVGLWEMLSVHRLQLEGFLRLTLYIQVEMRMRLSISAVESALKSTCHACSLKLCSCDLGRYITKPLMFSIADFAEVHTVLSHWRCMTLGVGRVLARVS